MSNASRPANPTNREECERHSLNSKGIILAVDDTSESLRILTDILVSQGYDVRPADSGELALASIEATQPELILLDIRMPGMDGFEVCRRLNERAKLITSPVIFLSGITDTKERVEGLRLGAVDFISKPFRARRAISTHSHSSRTEPAAGEPGGNGRGADGTSECCERTIAAGTCRTAACREGAARKRRAVPQHGG